MGLLRDGWLPELFAASLSVTALVSTSKTLSSFVPVESSISPDGFPTAGSALEEFFSEKGEFAFSFILLVSLTGSDIVKILPLPISLFTVISPLCSLTNSLTRDRPIPFPCSVRFYVSSW